ncbi:MAG TPA: hypothetical protein DCR24_15710 [Bacillus bacterium]|nr:hypothetical protein [Bacillus sp. (in: firmicutes)]
MSLLTNWLESLSYDLDISDACLKKLSPLSSCTLCLSACTDGAIFLENGKAVINQKACSSCGTCITICPTQAIKGQSPSREVVQGTLLINEASPLPSVNELLYFYKKGIRYIHFRKANSDFEQIFISTNQLLAAMGLQSLQMAAQLKHEPEQQAKLTRRDFFTKLTSDGKKTVLSSVTPAKWRFNEESFSPSNLFIDWAFFEVKLKEDNCTLCEACFNICPANVFVFADNTLKVDSQKCSGCQLCKDVCRKNGIEINQRIHSRTDTEIQVQVSTCSTCRTKFYAWTEANTCPICSSRPKHNFFL